MEKGKLFIISTPIGNMDDITYRAVKTLKEVDIIAVEDTRRTKKLLSHYDIHNRIINYHDYNKISVSKKILSFLLSNKNVGLVSDAGTPCISDPGFYLVRKALENDIKLIPIPGPSAVLASLIVSGLPPDRFIFEGFLPRGKGKKRKRLEELSSETRTLILFESPHRVQKTLKEIYLVFGNRKVVIAREITKIYEETTHTELKNVDSIRESKKPKGEITLVVEGIKKSKIKVKGQG
jgi:16S rRNA (cytidine1402-2'-O)-methyltransferase